MRCYARLRGRVVKTFGSISTLSNNMHAGDLLKLVKYGDFIQILVLFFASVLGEIINTNKRVSESITFLLNSCCIYLYFRKYDS